MNFKQFLKPDWRKVVIFFVVSFLLTLFLGVKSPVTPLDISITKIGFPALFLTIKEGLLGKTYKWNFVNLIINIAIWYLLSCLIIWIYDKVRKRS